MACHFWLKIDKCLKNHQKWRFKAKCKWKIKRRGIRNSFKWPSQISHEVIFTLKKYKNWYFYNFVKIKKFQNFQKKRNMRYRIMGTWKSVMPNVRLMYLFLPNIQPKTVSVDNVIFQAAILNISRPHTATQITFLEFWHHTCPKTHIFLFESTKSKIWHYVNRGWPDPSLSLACMTSDCKTASIFNFYLQTCL